MVDAAPAAVLQRVLVPRPGAPQPGLLPRLVDAQVRRVEQPALDDVGEVAAHVLEGHPGRAGHGAEPASPPPPLAPPTPRPTGSEAPPTQQRAWTWRGTDPACPLCHRLLICKMRMNLTTAAYLAVSVGMKQCNKSTWHNF